MLAPQIVLISDGGGVKQASPLPITGADKVARFIVGGLGKAQVALTSIHTVINGNPALVLRVNGEIDGVIAVRVEDGSHLRALLRPQPGEADPHRLRDPAHPAINTVTSRAQPRNDLDLTVTQEPLVLRRTVRQVASPLVAESITPRSPASRTNLGPNPLPGGYS
ncbi:hypothetical protein [Nonomuraea dietziae]|uniref:hypothetical protein n=1 Tax=Nonomuraea dietziae TaxID=65515 RepID=UPI0031DB05BB